MDKSCYILGKDVQKDTKEKLTIAIKRLLEEEYSIFYIGYDTDFCKLAHSILIEFWEENEFIKIFTYSAKHDDLFYFVEKEVFHLPALKEEGHICLERQLYNNEMLQNCDIVLSGVEGFDGSEVSLQYKNAIDMKKFIMQI